MSFKKQSDIARDAFTSAAAMTTNQDGPSADDFAMKVWREALHTSNTAARPCDDDGCVDCQAAARVLSEAFDKVRVEERARIVAWLQREAGKTHECYEHVLLDAADAIEQGAHDNG